MPSWGRKWINPRSESGLTTRARPLPRKACPSTLPITRLPSRISTKILSPLLGRSESIFEVGEGDDLDLLLGQRLNLMHELYLSLGVVSDVLTERLYLGRV